MYAYNSVAVEYLRDLSKRPGTESAISVLGGAAFAASAMEAGDWEGFCRFLLNVPSFATPTSWPNGIQDAMETFCHICMVDPRLVEVYLGATFAELCQEIAP